MSWLYHEVTEPKQICIIFDQHKASKWFLSIRNMIGQKKIEMLCIDIVCNIFRRTCTKHVSIRTLKISSNGQLQRKNLVDLRKVCYLSGNNTRMDISFN
jgi:hypothetical protein